MKMNISSKWLEKMKFESSSQNGLKVKMDAKPEFGGENFGAEAKELILMGLSGCTGMDVIAILRKMRIEWDDFIVNVEADLQEEHPKDFTRFHVEYIIKGKDIPEDKFKRAIELSQDRYCGVSATLKKAAEVTWSFKIEEA